METGDLSGFVSIISLIYCHHSCITGCSGRRSRLAGFSICKTPNRKPLSSSRKMEYSSTPCSFNKEERRGQTASCLFLYSSSFPLKSFILKPTLAISFHLKGNKHKYDLFFPSSRTMPSDTINKS